MTQHFLLHIGDGDHFKSSSFYNIWGINSSNSFAKGFIKKVKENDLLWFVKSKSNGLIIAVATYTCNKERIIGPLVDLTKTNEELGWTKTNGNWDIEVHFKDLYNLSNCELHSNIKGACGIRLYNDNCKIDLPIEYKNIVRYSKISLKM